MRETICHLKYYIHCDWRLSMVIEWGVDTQLHLSMTYKVWKTRLVTGFYIRVYKVRSCKLSDLVGEVSLSAGSDAEWGSVSRSDRDVGNVPEDLSPRRSPTPIGEHHLCRSQEEHQCILLPLEHRPPPLTNAEHFMCDQNVNFNLEKPASAHVRMGSRLRSRISLAGGRRLLQ